MIGYTTEANYLLCEHPKIAYNLFSDNPHTSSKTSRVPLGTRVSQSGNG